MHKVNIDNLALFARERGDETSWRALWDAVVHLPAWHAVGDARSPESPLVLVLREQPTLLLFTDQAKARAFATSGVAPAAQTSIEMPLPGSLTYISNLASRGVTQVVFNMSKSSSGFGYGLAALPRLAAALGVSDPAAPPPPPVVPTGDARLDALAEAFAADPGEAANTALFRYVYALPAWHLLARDEGHGPRPLFSMFHGEPVFLAYTSESLARAGLQARAVTATGGGNGSAAPLSILSLPVAQAVAAAERAMGLRGIVFNDASLAFFAPTRSLRSMLDSFGSSPPPPAPPAAQ